jgi:hypothetical protein
VTNDGDILSMSKLLDTGQLCESQEPGGAGDRRAYTLGPCVKTRSPEHTLGSPPT